MTVPHPLRTVLPDQKIRLPPFLLHREGLAIREDTVLNLFVLVKWH